MADIVTVKIEGLDELERQGMYLDRALEYEQQPPDDAWNAVEVFKKK